MGGPRASTPPLWMGLLLILSILLISVSLKASESQHRFQGVTAWSSRRAARLLQRRIGQERRDQVGLNRRPFRQLREVSKEELPSEAQVAMPPTDWGTLRTKKQCYEADGGLPELRVCVFEDLLLYNGTLLYVADDASEEVPPIRIGWLKGMPGDAPDRLHVTVTNQSQLGFKWDTAQVEVLPQAALLHQQQPTNFGHLLGEVVPSAHFILCKFLGDCDYASTTSSGTHLLFLQKDYPNYPAYNMPGGVREAFACLSPHPLRRKDDEQMQNTVFVLRRAVAGISRDVRAFHLWDPEHMQQFREPPVAFMQSYRRRLADCLGFDFVKEVAPTDPVRVLFVNRHYEEGRTILNQPKLLQAIRRMPELHAFPSAELVAHYPDPADTLRDQAVLFANTSLLIYPHGATQALNVFLPRGAQVIEVLPWVGDEWTRTEQFGQALRDVFSLEADLYTVQNRDRRRVMFNQDGLLEYKEYEQASPEHKIGLLERGECPPGVNAQDCPFWWNQWKTSVKLDWAALEPAVRAGLAKLAEQRQASGQPKLQQGTTDSEAAGTGTS